MAAAFTIAALKPKKLTGRFEYTHEMAAIVPELEMALRRDLADAIAAQMSTAGHHGQSAPARMNVRGFDTAITAAERRGRGGDLQRTMPVCTRRPLTACTPARRCEVSSVVPPDVYRHAATVYQTGSGESGSEAAGTALRWLHGVSPYVAETGGGGQRKKLLPARCRHERWRHHARRFGGGLWPTA